MSNALMPSLIAKVSEPQVFNYGLIGLHEMIRVYGEKLLQVMCTFDTVAGYIAASNQAGAKISLAGEGSAMIVEDVKKLQSLLTELNFPVSMRMATRLSQLLMEETPHKDVRTYLQVLSEVVNDEIANIVLLAVPTDKKPYYTAEKGILSDEVLTKFPSIATESEEARKCYSLGRPTASVFHSMRILEVGLISLAKELTVQWEHTNWEQLIRQIEDKTRKIGPTSGQLWREDLKFYSEAALQFRHFKDAWRNHVMHIRDSYNEDSALLILQSVNAFMTHLSSRLSETS